MDPEQAFQRLRQDAGSLLALPDVLADMGLSDALMNHPAIALGSLQRRLTAWGLA